MKIVVDARTMGSRPSGVGMYLFDFLKELIKYEEFEFILLADVATSEYIDYFRNLGIEIRTQGKEVYRSAGVYAYFGFIQEALNDIRPDLFWEVNAIIPVKLIGDHKTMITIHDMFPITHVKYFGFIYSIYFKYNLKKTLKYTDMILYNSNQSKTSTEKILPRAKDIKNSIAYIISNPLKEVPKIENDGYFLYVGNMEKRKGVDLLLKSYKEYRKRGGKTKLILAGKMQEEDIKILLEATQQEVDGIEYMDYVSHEKKQELFSNCECFVFPSKAEGFGMPILEVMKFYKPILVSNLEVYDEIIGDCVNEFAIHVSEKEQISNLCEAMMTFSDKVDKILYDQVLGRYLPENLGGIVRRFINDSIK